MAVKNVTAKSWGLARSADMKLWSAWPAGDNPGSSPALGVYGQAFQIHTVGVSPITVAIGDTQAAGSSLLMFVGTDRDQITSATHNKSGAVTQLADAALAAWAPYGGRLYGVSALQGGAGQSASVAVQAGAATIEKTLFAVEVKNGQTIVAGTPQELPASGATDVTSPTIVTTGPAVVLCFVIGDANVSNPLNLLLHSESIAAGWQQVCDVSEPSVAHVQMAAAALVVSGAGTYSCRWNFTPAQRGLFFMARVQD